MSRFKPSVTVLTNDSIRNYQNRGYRGSRYEYHEYPTYEKLKKDIANHLKNSLEEHISVSRSRRGEWGEWYEHWKMIDGKPKIIKSGWM